MISRAELPIPVLVTTADTVPVENSPAKSGVHVILLSTHVKTVQAPPGVRLTLTKRKLVPKLKTQHGPGGE